MSSSPAALWSRALAANGVEHRPRLGIAAPEAWEAWARMLFPSYLKYPFAPRHEELWEWAWRIERGQRPDVAFVAVWCRGGAKSTSAELLTTALGVRDRRKYALYVRETQDQADTSVSNVAAMLESDAMQRHYPQHADRRVGKFGNSRGWRRERIMTAGGYTVDAMGLDTATRGAKVDEDRPDLIILDDIDGKLDSPATTAKKIAVITTSILPAGSEDCAILAIQNLIIPDGVFSRLVDGRADFLSRRHVSGPHPAVEGLEWEWQHDPRTNTRRAVIVGGTATWAGQNLETCQRQMEDWGPSAFLKEAQHEVAHAAESRALKFDARRHLEDLTDDEARAIVALGSVFGGLDFGAWRFAFVIRASDAAGRVHQVAEYFQQRGPAQNHDTHARAIDALAKHYGAPSLRIWGDAANAQDIVELNRALKRIKSRARVVPVAQENKIRKVSVDRINDLLDRNALTYRRGVAHAMTAVLAVQDWPNPQDPTGPAIRRPTDEFLMWQLGHNAASAGEPMEGSRLLWEVEHWSYPVPVEGKAQGQDPDDHTADGADMCAADRYGIMSWLRPGKEPEPEIESVFEPHVLQEDARRSRSLKERKQRRMGKITDYSGGY